METSLSAHLADPSALKQIFTHNLNRLYFGKIYLNDKLEHLSANVSFRTLKLALDELRDDVQKHISRLNQIYDITGITPSDKECIPVQSIFQETFALEKRGVGHELLRDIDIMLYMQLIEHINITCYRIMRVLAKNLNYSQLEQLLIESLDESVDNDSLFVLITDEYLGNSSATTK